MDEPAVLSVGVVRSLFNEAVTVPLCDGVLAALEEMGISDPTIVEVDGALELPVVARALAASHDAVIAVGAVIEGETDHYQHVATQCSRGLMDVAVQTGTPVGNAVLTVRDVHHAIERSRPGPGNKGTEAARAAVRAALVIRSLG